MTSPHLYAFGFPHPSQIFDIPWLFRLSVFSAYLVFLVLLLIWTSAMASHICSSTATALQSCIATDIKPVSRFSTPPACGYRHQPSFLSVSIPVAFLTEHCFDFIFIYSVLSASPGIHIYSGNLSFLKLIMKTWVMSLLALTYFASTNSLTLHWSFIPLVKLVKSVMLKFCTNTSPLVTLKNDSSLISHLLPTSCFTFLILSI